MLVGFNSRILNVVCTVCILSYRCWLEKIFVIFVVVLHVMVKCWHYGRGFLVHDVLLTKAFKVPYDKSYNDLDVKGYEGKVFQRTQ
jgi:hypothetical protein